MDHKPETSFVVDELKRLDGQIDAVQDLTSLKPIFYQLEEVTRKYSDAWKVSGNSALHSLSIRSCIMLLDYGRRCS